MRAPSRSYDPLNRVTGSSGLTGYTRAYTYDLDGNRLTKTDNGSTTYTATYEPTDQARTMTKTGGSPLSFAYTEFGDLTADVEDGVNAVGHGHDIAGRLTGIDGPGTTNDASFALDALGRFTSRTINGLTDTFAYAGTSETVTRIVTGSPVDSLVDATGSRLGVKVGSTVNWFLPDPHGNVAGSTSGTTVANALRYDAYGQTIATGSAGGSPVATGYWKHQGRLDIGPPGISQPLYEAAARLYSPGLGAFTSLDTLLGTTQDPLSLNRFLYAEANPATLIDPTGHAATACDQGCGSGSKEYVERAKQAAKQAYDAAAGTNVSGAHPENGPSTYNATPEIDVVRAVWDSASNMAINTVTGTYNLVACGGINAYNPITCDEFDENVRALTDQGYRNARLQAELYALANGFGDAQRNLTSGDLYLTTRALSDVVLVAATLASARGIPRLATEGVESSVPTVTFSRSRAPGLEANYNRGVASGAPTRLTRVSAMQRDANRRAALRGQRPAPAGQSLDEYPFACSAQGGAGACVSAVPRNEQSYQGGVLSDFFRTHRIGIGDDFEVRFGP